VLTGDVTVPIRGREWRGLFGPSSDIMHTYQVRDLKWEFLKKEVGNFSSGERTVLRGLHVVDRTSPH
jgi:hypothetical protein